jgi:predicted small secreted protein
MNELTLIGLVILVSLILAGCEWVANMRGDDE